MLAWVRYRRFYLITATLLRYGIDELFPDHWLPWYLKLARRGLFWLRNQHPQRPQAARFRLAMEELGPVFIKFGQMLSTRRDLLQDDYATELALLQDRVAPFEGEIALKAIEAALEGPVEQFFSDLELTPIASASIAQVHGAKLKTEQGEADVVVKVIRPNIEQVIHADIELMRFLAQLFAKIIPDARRLRPIEVIEEYEKTIYDELDLMREAANGMQLRRNFENSDALYVPKIYADYCHKDILVMERIYAINVSDIAALNAQGTNMQRLAERGVEVFFTQVFRDSFFHADMHPGNVFVSTEHPDDPFYIGIDFGIVGTLGKEDKRYLAENFLGFFNRDYHRVAELQVESGWVPRDTNVEEFEFAIRTVCEPIFQKPLAEISFGQVLLNLFNTARRFDMQVQPQLVLLQKTLLYIEGLGRQLYPQLDLWQTAKPFLEDWMANQIGPKAAYNQAKAHLPAWGEKLPELPNLVYDSLLSLRDLPTRQEKIQQQLLEAGSRRQKGWYLVVFGSSILLASALLFPYLGSTALSFLTVFVLLLWFVGWRMA